MKVEPVSRALPKTTHDPFHPWPLLPMTPSTHDPFLGTYWMGICLPINQPPSRPHCAPVWLCLEHARPKSNDVPSQEGGGTRLESCSASSSKRKFTQRAWERKRGHSSVGQSRCPLEVAAFKFFVFSQPSVSPDYGLTEHDKWCHEQGISTAACPMLERPLPISQSLLCLTRGATSCVVHPGFNLFLVL